MTWLPTTYFCAPFAGTDVGALGRTLVSSPNLFAINELRVAASTLIAIATFSSVLAGWYLYLSSSSKMQ